MTPILALDLATKTGWATRDSRGRILSGVQDFSKRRGESPGMPLLRLVAWLRDVAGLLGHPEKAVVAFERAHHRGGPATELAMGMMTHAQSFAAEQGFEHTAVHTATLKKFATGSGRANKDHMVAEALRRFRREVGDDNEADALWVLAWAAKEIGEPIP